MKRLFCVLAFGVAGLANAGPLEDADKLLAAKAYDKAMPLYAKLAEAGNTEAQFRLGEMYWYGDGTAVDMKAASSWMQKAAARGHAGAIESLEILKQREARAADIAYWTTTYQGEDMVSGQYKCVAPQLSDRTETNEQIKASTEAYATWQICYNGFVANMNDAMPAGKRIPADIAKLLTPQEATQAVVHLDKVYGQIIAKAQQDANQVTSRYGVWRESTALRVAAENKARIEELRVRDRLVQQHQTQVERAVNRPPPLPTGKLQ